MCDVLLFYVDGNSVTANNNQILKLLQSADEQNKVEAIQAILSQPQSLEWRTQFLMPVIKYAGAIKSAKLLKYVSLFLNCILDLYEDETSILLCQIIRNELASPNEYIRALILRNLRWVKKISIVMSFRDLILGLLQDKYDFVRKNCLLLISSLQENYGVDDFSSDVLPLVLHIIECDSNMENRALALRILFYVNPEQAYKEFLNDENFTGISHPSFEYELTKLIKSLFLIMQKQNALMITDDSTPENINIKHLREQISEVLVNYNVENCMIKVLCNILNRGSSSAAKLEALFIIFWISKSPVVLLQAYNTAISLMIHNSSHAVRNHILMALNSFSNEYKDLMRTNFNKFLQFLPVAPAAMISSVASIVLITVNDKIYKDVEDSLFSILMSFGYGDEYIAKTNIIIGLYFRLQSNFPYVDFEKLLKLVENCSKIPFIEYILLVRLMMEKYKHKNASHPDCNYLQNMTLLNSLLLNQFLKLQYCEVKNTLKQCLYAIQDSAITFTSRKKILDLVYDSVLALKEQSNYFASQPISNTTPQSNKDSSNLRPLSSDGRDSELLRSNSLITILFNEEHSECISVLGSILVHCGLCHKDRFDNLLINKIICVLSGLLCFVKNCDSLGKNSYVYMKLLSCLVTVKKHSEPILDDSTALMLNDLNFLSFQNFTESKESRGLMLKNQIEQLEKNSGPRYFRSYETNLEFDQMVMRESALSNRTYTEKNSSNTIHSLRQWSGFNDDLYLEYRYRITGGTLLFECIVYNQTSSLIRNFELHVTTDKYDQDREMTSVTLAPHSNHKLIREFELSINGCDTIKGIMSYEKADLFKRTVMLLEQIVIDPISLLRPQISSSYSFRSKWKLFEWEQRINWQLPQNISLQEFIQSVLMYSRGIVIGGPAFEKHFFKVFGSNKSSIQSGVEQTKEYVDALLSDHVFTTLLTQPIVIINIECTSLFGSQALFNIATNMLETENTIYIRLRSDCETFAYKIGLLITNITKKFDSRLNDNVSIKNLQN